MNLKTLALLTVTLFVNQNASAALHSTFCSVLDSQYRKTDASFVIQSFNPTESEPRQPKHFVERITHIKGIKFPKYPGINVAALDENDGIMLSVVKRKGMDKSHDFAHSYRISALDVQLWDDQDRMLTIKSDFNYQRKLPEMNDVLSWGQYFFSSSSEQKAYYESYLISNDLVGQIKFDGTKSRTRKLIQCKSLSNNVTYSEGANH